VFDLHAERGRMQRRIAIGSADLMGGRITSATGF
jgi:hypothetical protein